MEKIVRLLVISMKTLPSGGGGGVDHPAKNCQMGPRLQGESRLTDKIEKVIIVHVLIDQHSHSRVAPSLVQVFFKC